MAGKVLKGRGKVDTELGGIISQLDAKENEEITNEIDHDRYNTFIERFFALLIDGVIIGIGGWLLGMLSSSDASFLNKILQLIGAILPYGYNIWLHGYSGQTIGKALMGVTVYDKGEQLKCSYYQAFLRDLIPLIALIGSMIINVFFYTDLFLAVIVGAIFSFLLLIWAILEIVSMLFNERRRAFHDLIAGTVVLKMKS